jgi:putative flippase GtrA
MQFFLNSLIYPKKDNSLKAQAVRQLFSGGIATLVDILIFKLCVVSGIYPMIAAVISFCLALLTNFTLSRYYVFGEVDRQKKKPAYQLLIYIPVSFVALGIFQMFLLVFYVYLGMDPVLVKIISVPVVFIWTIISSRYIIFDKK